MRSLSHFVARVCHKKKTVQFGVRSEKPVANFFICSVKENGRKRDFVSFKVHEKVFFERMDSNTKIHGMPKKRKQALILLWRP